MFAGKENLLPETDGKTNQHANNTHVTNCTRENKNLRTKRTGVKTLSLKCVSRPLKSSSFSLRVVVVS